ncbi:MAG: lipopolysaccharide assembly protein LapB [Pseudomonadota bacterium]|nr:lipopolysaccharide assembly protein LapB [Pseudomonadota bacterium]
MMELFWLLLPVAAASGWWAARREYEAREDGQAGSAEYFKGLNYLLDDKPDQAIDIFTRLVSVDRDTAETHLTLGNLFRRRGEVDRAIHIHRNLIARPTLSAGQRRRAMQELGEDYLRAGLFDRAEQLFQELAGQPGHTAAALARLIDIYEREQDWKQALACADRLHRHNGELRSAPAAHYCCELAEQALHRDAAAEAGAWLDEALARDPCCARASILRGRLAMAGGDHPAAIAALQAVERQDAGYLPEVLDPLAQCYAALDRQGELLAYLRRLHGRQPSGRLTAALAQWLAREESEDAALAFLEAELRQHPTVLGLRCYIDLKRRRTAGAAPTDLDALYRISQHLLERSPPYRCGNCGFVARTLHWRCFGCKSWNSVRPLPDLECRAGP